jgi:hypothetical protein
MLCAQEITYESPYRLDEKLIEEIDRIAGKRKRSQFIEEAVRRELALAKQRIAISKDRPRLDPTKYPHWASPELTSKWVHDMRQQDQAYTDARRAARQRERETEQPKS